MAAYPVSCTECGACCAAFRVSFHRSELSDGQCSGVPVAMAVFEVNNTMRMRGTDDASPRCIALQGTVGEAVRCGIYADRPSPCREFGALAEIGIYERACNRARAMHGLPALPVDD